MKRILMTCLLCATGASQAEPGVLEINQDCAAVGCFAGDSAGFPVTITQPGPYALSSDLPVSGDPGTTIGILVQASPVDLDLNGFTVSGGGSCSGNPVTACNGGAALRGIQVSSSGRLVRIHGGTVRGFANDGVEMFSVADGTLLEDLTLTENASAGLFASGQNNASIRLDRVAVTRNLGLGALFNSSGRIVVDDSVFSNNGGDGVSVVTVRAVFSRSKFLFNNGFAVDCSALCALGENVFLDNNSASASNEFSIVTLRDMGGNVCDDGACP